MDLKVAAAILRITLLYSNTNQVHFRTGLEDLGNS